MEYELLIATNNRGKLREYQELLQGLRLKLILPSDLGLGEVDFESGSTFEENASLKAKGYAGLSGLATLADDSGLEVDALGGRPGVYSARYGGKTTDQGRVELLLQELKTVPWDKRTARFRCVIAIESGNDGMSPALCDGECEGVICLEPRGGHGFGYDPVFFLPELGRTMAELTPQEKNKISHRARAAVKARQVLQELSEEKPA